MDTRLRSRDGNRANRSVPGLSSHYELFVRHFMRVRWRMTGLHERRQLKEPASLMAYDETVADRVRRALAKYPRVSKRKMFGGLTFMLNGNMCCGVVGKDLVLRLGDKEAARAMAEPHTRRMVLPANRSKAWSASAPRGTEPMTTCGPGSNELSTSSIRSQRNRQPSECDASTLPVSGPPGPQGRPPVGLAS